LFALGWGFESAAAAHFLEDSFGIEFGFEAFESPVYGLAFIEIHSTHAFVWLVVLGVLRKTGPGECRTGAGLSRRNQWKKIFWMRDCSLRAFGV
jgi:hypothetical protein